MEACSVPSRSPLAGKTCLVYALYHDVAQVQYWLSYLFHSHKKKGFGLSLFRATHGKGQVAHWQQDVSFSILDFRESTVYKVRFGALRISIN